MNATEELGVPLPLGEEHACSVSLPTWQHVVRYEQGESQVINALQCAYPRFHRHPRVAELVQLAATRAFPPSSADDPQESIQWSFTIAPTQQSAQRLCTFLQHQDVEYRSVHDLVWVIKVPVPLTRPAALFWQHTGEIVSSRCAKKLVTLLKSKSIDWSLASPPVVALDHTHAHDQLRTRLAMLATRSGVQVDGSSDVWLFPTGMAAIFSALRLICSFRPTAKTILVGFPYTDMLKLHQRPEFVPAGVHFFAEFNANTLDQIECILKHEQIAGIFTEFPTNPLLSCGNVHQLSALAHAHATPLVVDDTVGSFNISVLPHGLADVVVTSLTKLFSGTCNVMGGSMVLNPSSSLYDQLTTQAPLVLTSFLYEEDAQVLVEGSQDLEQRLTTINSTTQELVTRLAQEPLVAKVFYPSLVASAKQRFDALTVMTSQNSACYGPLVSLVLHGSEQVAAAFYDALRVAKGPSLGTNFTLCCPYTLLAHFNELEFVESCGVDRHLIRFSFGLEPVEELWQIIKSALEIAQEQANKLRRD